MLFWIGLAIAYVIANLAAMMWLGSRLGEGRISTRRVAVISTVTRLGPVFGLAAYVAARDGNWWVILIVGAAVAGSFWMLDGMLVYTEQIGALDAMRRIRAEQQRRKQAKSRKPPPLT